MAILGIGRAVGTDAEAPTPDIPNSQEQEKACRAPSEQSVDATHQAP